MFKLKNPDMYVNDILPCLSIDKSIQFKHLEYDRSKDVLYNYEDKCEYAFFCRDSCNRAHYITKGSVYSFSYEDINLMNIGEDLI